MSSEIEPRTIFSRQMYLHAGEHDLALNGSRAPRPEFRYHAEHRDRGGSGREHRHGIHGGRAAEYRVDQSAGRRTQNRGALKKRCAPREGALEMFLGYQQRQDRAAGGRVKRANDSTNATTARRWDGPNGCRASLIESSSAEHTAKPGIADGENFAAVEAIGRVTGNEKQQNAREEIAPGPPGRGRAGSW